MNAAVTVVLPTYNGARHVAAQIDSILAQTGVELVLEIVDDHSQDDTFDLICSTYAAHANVRATRNERNRGQLATLQSLLETVSTPYFAIADQDDVWAPDKLGMSVTALETTGADLVCTDLEVVDAALERLWASAWSAAGINPVNGRHALAILLKNPVSGATVVARSDLLGDALPFPPRLPMHDRWLALLAATRNGVHYIHRPLVRYRQHDHNLVGIAPRSIAGLRARARSDGQGSLARYLERRLAQRLAFVDALASRRPELGWPRHYRRYFSLGRIARCLLAPLYLACNLALTARTGILNLLVDTVLCSLARGARTGASNEHDVRRSARGAQ